MNADTLLARTRARATGMHSSSGSAHSGSRRATLIRRAIVVLMAPALIMLTAPGLARAAPPPRFDPPKRYYLSLGDSYGFGLQLDRFFAMLDAGTYTPDAFHTGYTEVFAQLMRGIRPDLQVVNYSCPGGGGDTTRFLTDGCFFTDIGIDLHNNFTGAQLRAAVTFLHQHPGQVSPITLSTGGDDIDTAITSCNADPVCVANSGLREQLSVDLTKILTELQSTAPQTEIIMYLPHNDLEADVPGSNALYTPYIDEMRAIAAQHRVRVVDGFATISLAGRACELTNLCTTDDAHPTDTGYALLGHLFFDTSGYQRLAQ